MNMGDVLKRDNEYVYGHLQDCVENLKGTRILVTGAAGFLGQTIVGFLNFLNSSVFDAKDVIEVITVDYEDFDICRPLNDRITEGVVHYVINCAGVASPKKYLKTPLQTLDVSYIGTKNVLEFAKLRSSRSVLMFSSSEVYGTADEIPTREEYVGAVTTFGNRSCYDIGKNVLESLSYVYYHEYQIPLNVLRPFNIYGPLMDFNDGRMVPNLCKSMIRGTDFSIYGNGKQTRTYCYVADAMVYMFGILLSGKYGEIYNIGSDDEEMSAEEVAKKAYELIDPPSSKPVLQPYPSEYPDQEPRRRCPSLDKVRNLTSYSSSYSFKEGFQSCYEFYKKKETEDV